MRFTSHSFDRSHSIGAVLIVVLYGSGTNQVDKAIRPTLPTLVLFVSL
jgi:hypothetical protein